MTTPGSDRRPPYGWTVENGSLRIGRTEGRYPDPSGGRVCLTCGGAIGPKPPPTRYQEAARSVAIDDIIEAAQSLTRYPWPLQSDVRLRIKAIIEENWRT